MLDGVKEVLNVRKIVMAYINYSTKFQIRFKCPMLVTRAWLRRWGDGKAITLGRHKFCCNRMNKNLMYY